MAVFDSKSRYVKYAVVATTTDRRGRIVSYLSPAAIPDQAELGQHRLRQAQRLDHLANHYLDNPDGFWRIAHMNDAMTPEAALDTSLIKIPTKS